MSEQQLQDLVEWVADRAVMPPGSPRDDVRRGEAALVRRRRGAAGLAVAATLVLAGGALAMSGLGDPQGAIEPGAIGPTGDASVPPTGPVAPTYEPGSPGSLDAAVTAVLDPAGEHVVPADGTAEPLLRGDDITLVTTQLGWQEPDRQRPLVLRVRVAASTVDAEWTCEGRCEITTLEIDGQQAWTTDHDDLGQDSTLLSRADGTVVALSVPPRLLASGAITRRDIEAVLTSPDLTLPPGSPTGPAPIPGALVDRIGLDALLGAQLSRASDDLAPSSAGQVGGVEVLWQADPATWSSGTCFWSRCEIREVDGVRLELSRPPAQGGPFAGYVSVEHQGPTWRTRVLMPEGAVALGDVARLLDDPRWPR